MQGGGGFRFSVISSPEFYIFPRCGERARGLFAPVYSLYRSVRPVVAYNEYFNRYKKSPYI